MKLSLDWNSLLRCTLCLHRQGVSKALEYLGNFKDPVILLI